MIFTTGRLTIRNGQVEKYVIHDVCPLRAKQGVKTEFVTID